MIRSYAIIDGTKVLGFFEDVEEGPIQAEFPYQVTAEYVANYPTSSSPTEELHINEAGELFWLETANLDEIKVRQAAKITQSKISANMDYFIFGGKHIQADDASFRELLSTNGYVALNNAMPPDWPNGWKTMDNSYVVITDVATWKTFYNTMVTTGTANFKRSQELKAAIAAASTVQEVEAIVW